MSKHGERLPNVGQESGRWRSQQIYMRMLNQMPHMRTALKGGAPEFGPEIPNERNEGDEIYRDSGGVIYFNDPLKTMFILVPELEELEAGQVGPMDFSPKD